MQKAIMNGKGFLRDDEGVEATPFREVSQNIHQTVTKL
jgi:hypothetical protein